MFGWISFLFVGWAGHLLAKDHRTKKKGRPPIATDSITNSAGKELSVMHVEERIPRSSRGEMALKYSTWNFILTGDCIIEDDDSRTRYKNSIIVIEDHFAALYYVTDYKGLFDGSAVVRMIPKAPPIIDTIFRLTTSLPEPGYNTVKMELRFQAGLNAEIIEFEFTEEDSRKMAGDAYSRLMHAFHEYATSKEASK